MPKEQKEYRNSRNKYDVDKSRAVMNATLEPKKEYKNITVVIRTINVKTEKVENTIIRNIDSPERRKWLEEQLIKTAMWAMFNGCFIEVINKEDDKEDE